MIRLYFKDNSVKDVPNGTLASGKAYAKKDQNLLAYALIDAVTKIVIALIKVKRKASKSPLKTEIVN